jgi:hypothetical protein
VAKRKFRFISPYDPLISIASSPLDKIQHGYPYWA